MLEEFLTEFRKSKMLQNYKKYLKQVSNNEEASAILDEYRETTALFIERKKNGEDIPDDEMERYPDVTRMLTKKEILKDFIEYDTKVYFFIEELVDGLRDEVKEAFYDSYK